MSWRVRMSSRFAAFLTSLGFQAGFNYDGFQNIGLAATLLPALRDLYPEPDDLERALERHLRYFNTNPYLATFTAGALIAAEEENLERGGGLEADTTWLDRFKQASGSVLGNLGDRFFWAGLQPLACLAGVIAFLLSPLYGILVLLLLFNIPHLLIRAEGMRLGCVAGRGVVTIVAGDLGARAIRWVRRLAALALGAVPPLLLVHPSTPDGVEGAALIAGTIGVGWLVLRRERGRFPSLLVLTLLLTSLLVVF